MAQPPALPSDDAELRRLVGLAEGHLSREHVAEVAANGVGVQPFSGQD